MADSGGTGLGAFPPAKEELPRRARRLAFLLLGLLFVVVNSVLAARAGIRTGGDGRRYLHGARQLRAGEPLRGKQALHAGYVALVALTGDSPGGLAALVALQLVLTAGGAGALYALTRRFGGEAAGLGAAALYLGNPEIAGWHFYVLTEAPYAAALVVALLEVARAREGGRRGYAVAAVAVLLAASLRPNGWVLLPLALCYWTLMGVRSRTRARWAVAGVLVLFLSVPFLVPPVRRAVSLEQPEVMLRKGDVIGGYRPSRIPMPQEPGPLATGWISGLGYVARHPVACARLALVRIYTELHHLRPYYSNAHTALIVVLLAPVYCLLPFGVLRCGRHPEARLVLVAIAGHLAIIGLTFADWDGRPLIHILPLIGAFAACGAVELGARHREGRGGKRAG